MQLNATNTQHLCSHLVMALKQLTANIIQHY